MNIFSGTGDLERYMEGLFQARVKGRVSPVDVARRLCREMKESRRVSVLRVYVPAFFMVYLHPDDVAALGECLPHLGRELALYLQEKARRYGYTMVAPAQVAFVTDERLDSGCVRVEAAFQDCRPREEAATAEDTRCFRRITAEPLSPARLMVLAGPDRERGAKLNGGALIIGRHASCDLVLTDPSVSRRHAQIQAGGEEYILTDLGSTNGVYCGGVRTTRKVLQDGDTITLGNTVIFFTRS